MIPATENMRTRGDMLPSSRNGRACALSVKAAAAIRERPQRRLYRPRPARLPWSCTSTGLAVSVIALVCAAKSSPFTWMTSGRAAFARRAGRQGARPRPCSGNCRLRHEATFYPAPVDDRVARKTLKDGDLDSGLASRRGDVEQSWPFFEQSIWIGMVRRPDEVGVDDPHQCASWLATNSIAAPGSSVSASRQAPFDAIAVNASRDSFLTGQSRDRDP